VTLNANPRLNQGDSLPLSSADIRAKLESSRKELLDLTFRNPLLNYRPLKARGVEVIGADPRLVFAALVRDGKKLSFAPAPAPGGRASEPEESQAAVGLEGAPPDDAAARAAYDDFFRKIDGQETASDAPDNDAAERSGLFTAESPVEVNTGSNVAKTRREPTGANTLQTACSTAELHRRLLGTMLTARTVVEEQGVNTLFLALGMLTWSEEGAMEADDESQSGPSKTGIHRSPLILIPVELQRASVSDRFALRYTDDDITSNFSLAYYLDKHFGLELPPVPDREDLDVERYLEEVALVAEGKSGWHVDKSSVALAFFSFNKLLMYKELEDAAWPEGQGPSRHSVLNALLGDGFREDPPRFGEGDQLDQVLPIRETRTVVEADGSQVLAIEDVKQGRNLVIQGPPGTGKSQSITNIVAEAVGQGKTVLFVSEKMAALEVVKRRLDSVGLGDSCLELHSNKTNKKAVLGELKRTLGLGKPLESKTADDDLQLLIAARDSLNRYCDAVNAPVKASGWTPHNLFGEWLRLQTAYGQVELPRLELPAGCVDWPSLDYRKREQVVTAIQAQVRSMEDPPVHHPFWGSARISYISTDADAFRTAFTSAENAVTSLRLAAARLAEKLTLPIPHALAPIEALAAAAQRAVDAPQHEGMQFTSGQWLARNADLADLIKRGAHMAALKGRHDATPEAWDTDVRETRQAVAEHGAKWFKFLLSDWRNAQKALRLLCVSAPPREVAGQLELLDTILDYRRTKATFREQEALGAMLFGAQWQGERSDWPVLSQLLQWIAGVHEEIGDGRLPKAFADFLSGNADLKALVPEIAAVRSAVEEYRKQVSRTVELLQFRAEIRFGVGRLLVDEPLQTQGELFGQWATELGRLQQMTAFNHLASEARTLELDAVVKIAATTEQGDDLLVPAFQRSYCQALLREVFTHNFELANFNGAVHAETVQRFRALDKMLLQHNRIHLASQHYQEIVKLNALMGSGGEGQLRVLTREFEKRSRHLPIRQLMERSGHAIQAIKPVFMMSPLSVATFLSPGHLTFDLVVFDEASQVKPVDALGALARGAQAVVVGDSKQLPPTNFFDSLDQLDGVVDEDNETADMESILGLFAGQGAPQRMLRWHYRSRHESLIAVSNHEFYDDKLVIFPSPDAARAHLGLTYRHLPDTVYDRGVSGTNRLEARAVAEASLAHARLQLRKAHANWQTLGVAAFSMGQMQAIVDQLEILRRLNPDTEAFFNAAPHNEPFFVKNLENVQGDERDVIFIGVGYGRDANGQVGMNFGPLNKTGGERRLNVLISRARLRCEVFTNLLPEDLDLRRTAARGVEAFKTFLAYARSTESSLTGSRPQEPHELTTAFESEVLSVLRANGCEVAAQVGCAGYFIDFAIVDPEHPGRYLLGIECDGPNYQSARSAHDRDRLRAEVLGAMGWRLHRIWSADWVHRFDDEVQKLLTAVASAKEASRALEAETNAQDAIETELSAADAVSEETSDKSRTDNQDQSADETPIQRVGADSAGESIVRAPLQPYVVANLPPSRHLDINDPYQLSAIAELVAAVVATESPVHRFEVSRRVAGALGVNRLTENIQAKVGFAADKAERAGLIRKAGDFYWSGQSETPVLRTRAALDSRSRSIDLIAPEEISLAVKHAVIESYGLPLHEAAHAACRVLGFERVTSDMKDRIDALVRQMVEAGAVLDVNGTLATP
jgi:very-short-patch-repair endonuclease